MYSAVLSFNLARKGFAKKISEAYDIIIITVSCCMDSLGRGSLFFNLVIIRKCKQPLVMGAKDSFRPLPGGQIESEAGDPDRSLERSNSQRITPSDSCRRS